MPTGTENGYDINVYKGKYRDFKSDVIAVRIKSRFIDDAEFTCLYRDLKTKKMIEPFILDTACGCKFSLIELKHKINSIIESWKKHKYVEGQEKSEKANCFFDLSGDDAGVDGLWSVDELLDSPVPIDKLNTCYNHLKKHIAANMHLFIESCRFDEDVQNTNNSKELAFVKEKHLGAFLTDTYYCEQYKVSNRGNCKESGGYPLAIAVNRLENILCINLGKYTVDDIVGAFLSQGYILRDKDEQMIKKDLMLSPGTSVPCYVLDIGKEVK